MNKKKMAILYDFDKTLCTKDMQEYSFIPSVNMESSEFWSNVDTMAKEKNMDRILAYMYYMLDKAKSNHLPIKKENFIEAGKSIELYPGVDTWFSKINKFADELGVELEHYIISSGIKEIIQGSKVKDEFKRIYACEFHYDENGVADWPSVVVNYTSKTQFLFRINKGVLDVYDDFKLNAYIPEDEREIPFRNMIYIGDGMTDVPCMKLVKENGGTSIAVYSKDDTTAKSLLNNNRVDFIAEADYNENSQMYRIVKKIIEKSKLQDDLIKLNRMQKG